MEKILATYAAGEIKTFEITGNYFELVQAKDPVDIYLQDRNGTNLALLKAAEASYYMKLHPAQYQRIQVKSDTAQDVAFIRADGECGTRNMSGIIRVVDEDTAGAYQKKSFVTVASDSVDTAVKRFAKIAIWNKSTVNDLAVQRIRLQCSIEQNSSLAFLSGKLAMHTESGASGGSAKFTMGYGKLANGLAISFDIAASSDNVEVTDSGTINQTDQVPESFGGTDLDLMRTPIIIKPGRMLVVTKTFDDSLLTSPVIFRGLFTGKMIGGDLS